jgi:20S proteasome alpha/beta subunit
MIGAGTGISYGSMRKIKDAKRLAPLGAEGIIACSGELADFQDIVKKCLEKYEQDLIEDDGACFYQPKDYFNWLSRKQYQRRLKSSPLYVTAVVAGIGNKDGGFCIWCTQHH